MMRRAFAFLVMVSAYALLPACESIGDQARLANAQTETPQTPLPDFLAIRSFFSLDDLLERNEKLKPKDVAGLLELLPMEFKKYSVAVFDSRSNHKSDPQHPRLLFFGPDARMIIGASTHPQDPAKDTLEIISYDEFAGEYRFTNLHFRNGRGIAEAAQGCGACHGNNSLRPNWDSYSIWPGVYGGFHDRINMASPEHKLFTAFLKGRSGLTQSFIYPFAAGDEQRPYYTKNNAALTFLLNAINRDRIARLIVKSPQHSTYQPALLAVMLQCPGEPSDYLPVSVRAQHKVSYAALRQEVATEAKAYYDDIFGEALSRLHLDKVRSEFAQFDPNNEDMEPSDELRLFLRDREPLDYIDEASITIMAGMRYLLENRPNPAANVDDWSMTSLSGSYAIQGSGRGIPNLIGHYLFHLDPTHFASNLQKYGVTAEREVMTEEPYFYMAYTLTDKSKAACADLRAQVK